MSKKASSKVERIRIAVRVENGRLSALDAFGQEQIDKLPLGRLFIEIDTEEPEDGVRNLYMAGIGVLFDNVDGAGPGGEWPTPNHLRREILREIGFAEPIMRVDGIKKEPRSMARGHMTYDELVLVLEVSRAYCTARWKLDPFQSWADEKDAEAAMRAQRGAR